MKSWEFSTISSYLARGRGYARKLVATSLMGIELLPTPEVDAINYSVILVFSNFLPHHQQHRSLTFDSTGEGDEGNKKKKEPEGRKTLVR